MRLFRIIAGILIFVLTIYSYSIGTIKWRGKITRLTDSPGKFWMCEALMVMVGTGLLYYGLTDRSTEKNKTDQNKYL